ncbi:hypothetical protein FT663_04630 [Candidozyma haemuli var. vulneris]|nr:hypothetical protein FT662_04711 [[Candida] haemuloni var. vulneris]KAF3987030.1 hypothetical protein FT663_04630 [[Candida] haemuloni var. vulneris]
MTRPSKIVASPYTAPEHLLDLSSLTPVLQDVACALGDFAPTSARYAYDSYIDSFNVAAIVSQVQKTARIDEPIYIYVIVFRSILKKEIAANPENTALLYEADRLSHAEATASGGLLKYWYGVPDPQTGQNLATCWWRSPQDARAGGTGKSHQSSVGKVKNWYKLWRVEQYELELGANYWNWRHLA